VLEFRAEIASANARGGPRHDWSTPVEKARSPVGRRSGALLGAPAARDEDAGRFPASNRLLPTISACSSRWRNANMEMIRGIAGNHGIAVIEDAAAAIGSECRGRGAVWPISACASRWRHANTETIRSVAGNHGIAMIEDGAAAIGSECRGPGGGLATRVSPAKTLTAGEGRMMVAHTVDELVAPARFCASANTLLSGHQFRRFTKRFALALEQARCRLRRRAGLFWTGGTLRKADRPRLSGCEAGKRTKSNNKKRR
jgi:hypothetical protein